MLRLVSVSSRRRCVCDVTGDGGAASPKMTGQKAFRSDKIPQQQSRIGWVHSLLCILSNVTRSLCGGFFVIPLKKKKKKEDHLWKPRWQENFKFEELAVSRSEKWNRFHRLWLTAGSLSVRVQNLTHEKRNANVSFNTSVASPVPCKLLGSGDDLWPLSQPSIRQPVSSDEPQKIFTFWAEDAPDVSVKNEVVSAVGGTDGPVSMLMGSWFLPGYYPDVTSVE